MKKVLNVFDIQDFIFNELKLKTDDVEIKLLNTKKDLLNSGVKNKAYLQYIGIDYKAKNGMVKFVIYVVNKTIINNDNSISKTLDNIREVINSINLPAERENFGENNNYYTNNKIKILEEKYNNTDTLEFIYSIVIGIETLI